MYIDLYSTPTAGKRDLLEKNAVVVDALRATSTITTAVQNGCREVIPVSEISAAADVAARLGRDNVLMCGERGGLPISGFDLSNSPLEYGPERVAGRTLVMTTTNGTQAIASAREARSVMIGCFLNAGSAARMLHALGGDVAIVCAGTMGRYSMDDILAAGAIIERLSALTELTMCDLSVTALTLYRASEGNLHGALAGTMHYERLKDLNFTADLDFCLQQDVMDCVPMLFDGVVRKAMLNQ